MSTGRFCSGCGSPLGEVTCESCGQELSPGARFCNNCGAAVGAPAAGGARSAHRPDNITRMVAGAAILVLLAFVAGEAAGHRSGPDVSAVDPSADAPPAGMPTAPDISQMSPQEAASRLFNRVIGYSEKGQLDSARFFAPMAIEAYQMAGPLDLHARYDVGVISAAIGDAPMARAQADTILAAQPNNLLGLVLAIRAADMAGDQASAGRFRKRLVAAAPTERPKALPGYAEHAADIDAALKKAGGS